MKPVNGICAYNGIMIANWEQFITPEICNELIVFFSGLKLNVFAEIAAPKYTVPATAELSGMVFVNGSVMSSGERRDYFELLPMRKALDSATSQACLREFTILMCDIVEDEAVLANAVLRRSFTWCGYYGAIPWVGKRSSLTDASRNFVVDSPDSAFAFLKKDRVVDVHTTWRLNSTVFRFVNFLMNRSPIPPFPIKPSTLLSSHSFREYLKPSTCITLPTPTNTSKLLMSSISTGFQKSFTEQSIPFQLLPTVLTTPVSVAFPSVCM